MANDAEPSGLDRLTVHEELLVRTTGIVIRTVTNLQIGEGVGNDSFVGEKQDNLEHSARS